MIKIHKDNFEDYVKRKFKKRDEFEIIKIDENFIYITIN